MAGPGFENIVSGKLHPAISRNLLRMIEELRGRLPGWESSLRALTWELMILMQRMAPPAQKRIEPRDYERLAPALQTISNAAMTGFNVGGYGGVRAAEAFHKDARLSQRVPVRCFLLL